MLQSTTQRSARCVLTFVRAVRATLKAKEEYTAKHIDKMEEYVGMLRVKRAMIQLKVSKADEQLGRVKEALDSDGIAEVSLSDNESSSASLPPQSSDFLCREGMESDVESDNESSTSYAQSKGTTHETSGNSGTLFAKDLDDKIPKDAEFAKQEGLMQTREWTILCLQWSMGHEMMLLILP